MSRKITFFVHPVFELLDLSGPCSAFNMVNELYSPQYHFKVASSEGGAVIDSAGITIFTEPITDIDQTETIIVVGGSAAHQYALSQSTRDLLWKGSKNAERMCSVCTGAFILADVGILNARRATTHWRYAGLLQSQYPDIEVDADRIFINEGNIWTSAGMTAGMDLALALIEKDCGPEVAKAVAKNLVIYHRRLGGQSQYSTMLDITPTCERVRNALCYARENLNKPLTVERLSEVAGVSLRQFNRIFLHATGTTPAKAIERLRLDMARPRIEEDLDSLEKIALEVGFGSEENMRRSCVNIFGRSPRELRRAARSLKKSFS